jgi:choline dehydrogenase
MPMTLDSTVDFAQQARANQDRLASALKASYDFIVCGAGSSGCVVARRLAENPDVSVLLLEAGGADDAPGVTDPRLWPTNLGSERDWGFRGLPNPRLNGRAIPLSMGKVLGGGSSINVMVWARGHQEDWDLFADEARDPGWGYASVLDIYRRIEDWRGVPDAQHRGTGGEVFVQPTPAPGPLAYATIDGARSIGIPAFASPNGAMMEGPGGAAILDVRIRDGKRQSVFRSYVYPYMDRPNITVLTGALVTRLTMAGQRATGVEIFWHGNILSVGADREVVLSLGAMHTPKVLMYSGIGDESELKRLRIPARQHLPGVGKHFQDHVALPCIWESKVPLEPRNNLAGAGIYWSTCGAPTPDVFICHAEIPFTSEETDARFAVPPQSWTLCGGLSHPKSRGRLRLSGPDPRDPIHIDANTFGDDDDLKAAVACVEMCREIGNSAATRPLSVREVMPGNLTGGELENYVRDAAVTYWHETGTAKMGPPETESVVDGALKVYGIDNLRVADGSIMPRVTAGNTMAPCVIIGERAAEILVAEHAL